MSASQTEIRSLFLIEERPTSLLVEQHGRRVWLPRSLISWMRKEPRTMAGQEIRVKIPDWLVDEKGLLER